MRVGRRRRKGRIESREENRNMVVGLQGFGRDGVSSICGTEASFDH